MSKLFLITGPSGVGKTSTALELLRHNPKLQKLVTFTTRPPRAGERHGQEYYFIDEKEFANRLEQREFFEQATIYHHRYGNSLSEMKRLWSQDYDVLMVVDIQGVKTITKAIPEAISIFILPDNRENLINRMKKRGHNAADFSARLANIDRELADAIICNHQIINAEGQLARTVQDISNIIKETDREASNPAIS